MTLPIQDVVLFLNYFFFFFSAYILLRSVRVETPVAQKEKHTFRVSPSTGGISYSEGKKSFVALVTHRVYQRVNRRLFGISFRI